MPGAMMCRATTNAGNPCPYKAKANGYCGIRAHQRQANQHQEDDDEEASEVLTGDGSESDSSESVSRTLGSQETNEDNKDEPIDEGLDPDLAQPRQIEQQRQRQPQPATQRHGDGGGAPSDRDDSDSDGSDASNTNKKSSKSEKKSNNDDSDINPGIKSSIPRTDDQLAQDYCEWEAFMIRETYYAFKTRPPEPFTRMTNWHRKYAEENYARLMEENSLNDKRYAKSNVIDLHRSRQRDIISELKRECKFHEMHYDYMRQLDDASEKSASASATTNSSTTNNNDGKDEDDHYDDDDKEDSEISVEEDHKKKKNNSNYTYGVY